MSCSFLPGGPGLGEHLSFSQMRVRPTEGAQPSWFPRESPALLSQALPSFPQGAGPPPSAELAPDLTRSSLTACQKEFMGATGARGLSLMPAGAATSLSSPAVLHQGPRYPIFLSVPYLSPAQLAGWHEGLIRACRRSAFGSQGEKCCLYAGYGSAEEPR